MPLHAPPVVVAPYHQSGLYYAPLAHPVNAAPTLNQLTCVPIYLRAGSWDRIGVNITSGGTAGSVVRLGVYYDDGTGFPGALAFDAGTVATTGTGVKEITIAQALGSGLHWVAAVGQVAVPTATCCQTTAVPLMPMGLATPNAVAVTGYFKASVSAGLPDPFGGTVTNVVTSAVAPIVWLRRV